MNKGRNYGIYMSWDIIQSQKEGCSIICYNMNEPWSDDTKLNKPDTEVQMLYDFTYIRYLK